MGLRAVLNCYASDCHTVASIEPKRLHRKIKLIPATKFRVEQYKLVMKAKGYYCWFCAWHFSTVTVYGLLHKTVS